MNSLIQTITDYTTTLEQKLSALEARVALLETENEELKKSLDILKTANTISPTHSEVEIELILDEDTELNNEVLDTTNEVAEEALEQIPQTPEEPLEEPVVEPIIEPAPQPKAKQEPAAAKTQHHDAQPLQTSLFGSAVEDIRQAISLGDRFLFQRELFAGNGEMMQQALDEINALGSLDEALTYVHENFEWNQESSAAQLFENVLKRRFG